MNYYAYLVFSTVFVLAAATSWHGRAHLSRKVSSESKAWRKANALPLRSQYNGYPRALSQQCSASCDQTSWSERVLDKGVTVRSREVRVCTEKSNAKFTTTTTTTTVIFIRFIFTYHYQLLQVIMMNSATSLPC